MRFMLRGLFSAAVTTVLYVLSSSQAIAPSSYQQLQWRMIGPYRGGRTVGATGVKGHPGLFYIGVNNGGVWKTDDFGETWEPIFDGQPTGSIGALAVAPSDPETIYVGSGEGLQRPDLSVGDGVYKSADGGKTWRNMGLTDGQQIGAIIVDPSDKNRLFVAVVGHPYGPNPERGVFRSLDGGQSWQKVLFKDVDTGAIALGFDPSNSQTIYADLWAGRQGPWENGAFEGPNSGLYKSTDGGDHWQELTNGLPVKEGLSRIGFSICPSQPSRIYALVGSGKGGLYRSDDAGASWQFINGQDRIWGRGDDFAEVRADPKNPDVIYIANTSTYKSTDGGKTFQAWKGAPGGDDYHTVWIDPDRPDTILLACDQGAVITVNGGRTWSSWYNQPTAQFYHVIADNQFPYWVYGGQQESGSVGIASRGNDGEITFREWHPVGAEEYGYIAPDPLNPNIIYGGKLSKFDRVTGQVQDVAPTGDFRFLRTAPLAFSPADPHALYYAGNVLFKSEDGAHSWTVISPDLSREHPDIPETVGTYKKQSPTVARRGVIYSLGLSPRDKNLIWAGTDDGQIDLTRDGGKTWLNVTPTGMRSWEKVSIIDPSHFDSDTAYAAVNDLRLDDLHPHILKTHDGGKSWEPIVQGLPVNAPVNSVKEDPAKAGLLFCGTELAVYFSVDDGANWNPLRMNMPATSIRDLVIHDNDLVVGTHGRSFWILDDIGALRAIKTALQSPVLYPAEIAYRYRRDTNSDTPLPPEVPAGKNPPDGAIFDYWLPNDAKSVTLEVLDDKGHVVRRYTSEDKPDPVRPDDLDVPTYWIRPFQPLGRSQGGHRFVWDLYWQPLIYVPFYPISAVFRDTPPVPSSPLAAPGNYSVRLTVDGEKQTQPFKLVLDPRVKTPAEDIRSQYRLAMACYDASKLMMAEAGKIGEKPGSTRRFGRKRAADTYSALAQAYQQLMSEVDGADMAPTQMMEEEFRELNERAKKMETGK
jgi:photosystem II stability/assembly factor-like uncharacterized protein